jgi:hypothetical protein
MSIPSLGLMLAAGAGAYAYYAIQDDAAARENARQKAEVRVDPTVWKRSPFVPFKEVMADPSISAKDLVFVGNTMGRRGLVEYNYYIPDAQSYTKCFQPLGFWR